MVKRSPRSLPSDAMMTPSQTSHLCRRNRLVGFERSRVAANTVQWPTSVAHEISSARKLVWQRYPVSFCHSFSLKDLMCAFNLWCLGNSWAFLVTTSLAIYTILFLKSVCLSAFANCLSQFLLDRLGKCL